MHPTELNKCISNSIPVCCKPDMSTATPTLLDRRKIMAWLKHLTFVESYQKHITM